MKKISFNDYIPAELTNSESCRLVTTEQYKEYQLLKEEHKPITWDELKEKAKEMGYVEELFPNECYESIKKYDFLFDKTGWFSVERDNEIINIAYGLDYDKMLMIMRGLE